MGNRNSSSTGRPQVPASWDASQMPSQKDKLAIVTGANSGIGYEAALQLARKGAHVVLACRNETRGKEAEKKIREALASESEAESEAGSVEFMKLDVSDLSSVKTFAETFKKSHERLDLLINNAGVMGGSYATTVDGYERQFATNHLGHFSLTAQLFDVLKRSAPSRIVNVSSFLHRQASLNFNEDEIMVWSEKKYKQWLNYCMTKLCNVLFTLELDRRIRAAGVEGVTAVACHPGLTTSNLLTEPATTNASWFWLLFFKLSTVMPHQSTQMGALPSLYAATGRNVRGGDFFGPRGLGTIFGYPRRENPSKLCQSTTGASKLWELSEKLAYLTFRVET